MTIQSSKIKVKNGSNWDSLLDIIYPIGSIYSSYNSNSPASVMGGTWVAIEGRMLIGANGTYAATTTGGSASVTLAVANLPSHNHSVGAHAHTVPAHGHGNNISFSVNSSGYIANGVPSAGGHTHVEHLGTNQAVVGATGSYSTTTKVYGEYASTSKTTAYQQITASAGAHTHNLPNHTHTLTKSGGVTDKAAFNTNNSAAFNSGSTGSGTAITTISPYLAVYMWRRTA